MKEAYNQAAKLTHTAHTFLAPLFGFVLVLNELSLPGFLHPPIVAFGTPTQSLSISPQIISASCQGNLSDLDGATAHGLCSQLARPPLQHTKTKDWKPGKELSSMQFRNKFFYI